MIPDIRADDMPSKTVLFDCKSKQIDKLKPLLKLSKGLSSKMIYDELASENI